MSRTSRERISQKAKKTRRNFLIGAASSAGALGLLALGNCAFGGRQQAPEVRVGSQTDLSKRVAELDPKIKEVGQLAEVAPEIADLALSVVAKRMGSESFPQGKIQLFDNHQRYLQTVAGNNTCIGETEDPYRVETTYPETGLVFVSLSPIVRDITNPKNAIPHPATRTAEVVIHAGYHHLAKVSDYTPQDRTPLSSNFNFTKKSGLAAYHPIPEQNLPGKTCYSSDGRYLLDEVIVESSALETLREAGVDFQARGYRSFSYAAETQAYTQGVIQPYFPNDHIRLLRYQQAGDHTGYFRALGQKIDPKSPDPIRIAELHTINILVPFLKNR